ncbi:glycosyltransferase family 4 protein [Caulifigura coniformis]|nr:glycosyltransferase family 4 protein [Caulifigura coniformis]
MANAPRRVLMLMPACEVRGSTVQALTLAQGLSARGYVARVLCQDASQVSPEKREGVQFLERPAMGWPIVMPIVRRLLARDLDPAAPTIIHAQHRCLLPLARWLSARWSCPVVLSVNDYLNQGELLHCDATFPSAVVAVSESVRDELLTRAPLRPETVHVIHGGVLVPDQETPSAVLDPKHAPVIGTAGPLEAAKGLKYFLAAAPIILQEQPLAQFLVAGAGPEERNLRRLARELGVNSNVTFVPSLSDFAVSLDAMDVYVLPSLKQGLGTIMLEAMSRAIPVIATSSGGVYSVIDEGVTGMLVPPSDSAALAQKVLELLRDPLRARAIGENAREMVQRDFPIDMMITETVTLYERVLGSHPVAA